MATKKIDINKIKPRKPRPGPEGGHLPYVFRKIFRGKSANTPGFLIAALVAEGLIERVPGKTRVHQTCDPATFLASLDELKADTGMSAKKPVRNLRTTGAPVLTKAQGKGDRLAHFRALR
jgi:hypothetical protein